MKFWYTVCVLETKTDRTKTFPQVRWNGLTHKVSISYQYTYAQCITSRESHSLSRKTSSSQKGSLKWRDQKLSRRSLTSLSDILFYSLSITFTNMIKIMQLFIIVLMFFTLVMNIMINHKVNQINDSVKFMACDAYAYDQDSAPEFCK